MKKILILIFLFSTSCSLLPEERHLHLNGTHLDPKGISQMDQVFGVKVDNGNYWINDYGQWGYENNTMVMGSINMNTLRQVLANDIQQPNQQWGNQPNHHWENEPNQQWGNQANEPQPAFRPPGGTEINTSQNGSVVSGNVGGKHCTYVTAGGMTMKSCD